MRSGNFDTAARSDGTLQYGKAADIGFYLQCLISWPDVCFQRFWEILVCAGPRDFTPECRRLQSPWKHFTKGMETVRRGGRLN